MSSPGKKFSAENTVFQMVIPLALLIAVIIISSPDRQVAILNTLALGLGANLIAIPAGIGLARVCINSGPISWFTRLICLSFLFVPLYVHVSAWDSAVGKLGWLTGASWSINTIPLGTWAMAIWVHGLAAIPMVAVVVWYGMMGTVRIYEEQAELDASSQSVFWYVTLPRLFPVIGVCVVWVFVTCAREIAVTDIYRVGTLAEQIYLGYSLGEIDTLVGPGFALSAIAIVGGLIVTVIVPYLNQNFGSQEQLQQFTRKRSSTRTQILLSVSILAALVLIPAINLCTRASRFVENVDQVPVARYTVSNFFQVVTQVPGLFATELCWSALIALISSITIVALSILLVWRSLESRIWKMILLSVFAVSCSLPGPVIGSAVLDLRSSIDWSLVTWLFDRTIFGPVCTNVVFCLPVSLILVWFILGNTPTDALEHATLEGANSWARLTRLFVASNFRSIVGLAIITFANCFGELSASQLAVPPGIDTIPRRMLGMLHSGVNDQTAGLTIVSVLFIVAIVLVGYTFVYWNQRINKQ